MVDRVSPYALETWQEDEESECGAWLVVVVWADERTKGLRCQPLKPTNDVAAFQGTRLSKNSRRGPWALGSRDEICAPCGRQFADGGPEPRTYPLLCILSS